MNNTMTYKGYTARVEFDPRDNIFVGLVLSIEDTITFPRNFCDSQLLTKSFGKRYTHVISALQFKLKSAAQVNSTLVPILCDIN